MISVESKMHLLETEKEYKPLVISSKAFKAFELIPKKYTCLGQNINPPLEIDQLYQEIKSFALIVDDPDAAGGSWLHWLVWNIPVTHHIHEAEVPGIEGLNDFGICSYKGPCPPNGTHHYFFKVYGLDDLINLEKGSGRSDVVNALQNHIVAYGELIGLFTKGY
jgi:hypothetical protein